MHAKLVTRLAQSPSFDFNESVIESAVNSALKKFLGLVGASKVNWRVCSRNQVDPLVSEWEVEVGGTDDDIALFRATITTMTHIANCKASITFVAS